MLRTIAFGMLCFWSLLATPSLAQNSDLLEKAQNGDANAQFQLGVAYYAGDGVDQNFTEMVRWWRLAAEQGFVLAQYNLGSGAVLTLSLRERGGKKK